MKIALFGYCFTLETKAMAIGRVKSTEQLVDALTRARDELFMEKHKNVGLEVKRDLEKASRFPALRPLTLTEAQMRSGLQMDKESANWKAIIETIDECIEAAVSHVDDPSLSTNHGTLAFAAGEVCASRFIRDELCRRREAAHAPVET